MSKNEIPQTIQNTKETISLNNIEGIERLKQTLSSIEGVSLKNILETEEGREKYKIKKIILAGPPRSGKSCLREGLKQAIKNIPDAPYPYVLTACPDGEGSWFQEAMNTDPEAANKFKADYKSKFTPEFVSRVSNSVRNLSLPINFIDIGGITSPENETICKDANAAILICGEESVIQNKPEEWKLFFNKLNIPIIAEVYSDYSGKEDLVKDTEEDKIFRGSVHHLERGEQLSKRDMIQALAEYVINFEKD